MIEEIIVITDEIYNINMIPIILIIDITYYYDHYYYLPNKYNLYVLLLLNHLLIIHCWQYNTFIFLTWKCHLTREN